MPTAPQIDAPQTLTGLFPDSSDGEDDDGENAGSDDLSPCYENQSVILSGETLMIRQFDFHSHNANRVWPGTFNLSDYLLAKTSNNNNNDDEKNGAKFVHQWGRVLELGTATGLLAIRLTMACIQQQSTVDVDVDNDTPTSIPNMDAIEGQPNDDNAAGHDCCCTSVVTSDVQDERGEVQSNLEYNYELNHILDPPLHVPHTWGSGWNTSMLAAGVEQAHIEFDTIVASDILLYVSAYGALIETLEELMPPGSHTKFVMSWNRRMKESAEFFDRAKQAGFSCTHEGKCIYTFVRADDDNETIQ
eukprot:scaffold38838_cov56-Attheya_sp.AAC.1